jgi:hypothetical protein
VYALRERATGAIVLVGRRVESISSDLVGSTFDGTDADWLAAMESSLQPAGDLELIVLAEHIVDPAEALRIENAVMSAYLAARVIPERSAPAEAVRFETLQSAGRRYGADDVSDGGGTGPVPGFLDAGHRQRLEDLILRQQQEIAELNDALDRVRALRDLQQWAGGPGQVRISDLDRALGTSS